MRFTQVLVLASVATALACGGSSPTENNNPPPPPPPGTHDVTVKDFSFSPSSITIKVGETVRWTNNGPSVHRVVADGGLWDSQGLLPPGTTTDPYGNSSSTPGASFSFTFTQAGTYTYHCMNHPPSGYPSFTGTVIVQ
jgi:plastocyanin